MNNRTDSLKTSLSDKLTRNMLEIPAIIRRHILTKESVLKPKQKEAVKMAMDKIDPGGDREIAMVMPTATGKMVIIARMLAALCAPQAKREYDKKILFVSDGVEGIKQARDKMKRFAQIEAGVYYQFGKDWKQQVTVTTFHSWQSGSFPIDPDSIDLVILDEAHKAISEARLATLQNFKHAIWIAVTASHKYNEEQDLLHHFKLAYKMGMREAVNHGLICSFRNILLRSEITIDLAGLPSGELDYNERVLSKALNIEARNRIGADFILFSSHFDTGTPLRALRGIISCVDIAHAKDMAEQLNALFDAYYPGQAPEHGFARAVYGTSKDRDDLLRWHQEGKIQYLSFADLLIHNYDDPGIVVCINLRLSTSMVLTTQRGGRTTRLDPANPAKVALIADMVDNYNDDTHERPMLYAEAIGEIAVITDEVTEMAQAQKQSLARGLEGGRVGSIPIELRHIARDADLRIITDHEVILSIIRENARRKVRWKTDRDMAFSDIRRSSSASKNAVASAFAQLKGEWERHNAEPDRWPKPPIDLYQVRQKGIGPVAAISDAHLDAFTRQYLNGKIAPFKTENDLSPREVASLTGLGPSTIREIFHEVKALQNQIQVTGKARADNPIRLSLVRETGSSPFLSLRRDDFPRFVNEHLKGRIYPKKSADQLSPEELAKIAGRRAASTSALLRQIWKQWQDYHRDPAHSTKPLLTVTRVRGNGSAVTYALLKDDLRHFLNLYQHGQPIRPKTPEDSNTYDLQAATGYSRNSLNNALLKLDKEWASHFQDPAGNAKPTIPLYIVISDKKMFKAIPTSSINQFVNLYLRGRLVRPKAPDDMTAEDIAKFTTVSPGTIKTLLRKILNSRNEQDASPIDHPGIQVNVVKATEHYHAVTIKRMDVELFLSQYLPEKRGELKSADDLTAADLSKLTGYGVGVLERRLADLAKNWRDYQQDPQKRIKPPLDIKMVYLPTGRKSRLYRSIRSEDLQVFTAHYLNQRFVRIKTNNDLTVSDIAALTGISKPAVFIAFSKTTSGNSAPDAVTDKTPKIHVYDVKVKGASVHQAIHASDFPCFIDRHFPYLIAEYRSDGHGQDDLAGFLVKRKPEPDRIPLREIIAITGLSKYVLMKAIHPLQLAWKQHYACPDTVPKPKIHVFEEKSANQFKTLAIALSQLFEFVSFHIPQKKLKKKSLERIYEEIQRRTKTIRPNKQ